ncbi:MAG: FimB/Mfa2 family fimbrial subunit [Rikenellaceae bacterium]
MQKLFLSVAMLATLMCSCSEGLQEIIVNDDLTIMPDGEVSNDYSSVKIALKGDDESLTRSAITERWESSITMMTIFAFDSSNSLIVKRDLSAEQLDARSALITLPKYLANSQCQFIAVANVDTSTVDSYNKLMSLVEESASVYNGMYDQVTKQAMRANGFAMSGSAYCVVGEENTTVPLSIVLARTVAKVTTRVNISDDFLSNYPLSSLEIKSVTITRAATLGSVAGSAGFTTSHLFTHNQVQSSAMENLFYIFENGAKNPGSRVVLEINAVFDRDGNSSTTDDRTDMIYPVELTGAGDGTIKRNGHYHVAVTIRGLLGQDCDVSITAADWANVISQDVELGG